MMIVHLSLSISTSYPSSKLTKLVNQSNRDKGGVVNVTPGVSITFQSSNETLRSATLSSEYTLNTKSGTKLVDMLSVKVVRQIEDSITEALLESNEKEKESKMYYKNALTPPSDVSFFSLYVSFSPFLLIFKSR